MVFNRYSFEALDGESCSDSPKRTQEFDAAMPMDGLLSPCADLAHLVARTNPGPAPRRGWTAELGLPLHRQTVWSFHRIRFEDLVGDAGVRHP